MFRSFIYLDEEKLYSYKRLIDNGMVQPKLISTKKVKSASAGVKNALLSITNEQSYSTETDKDVSWDYDRFELSLSALEGEDYFDFLMNDDNYDISTISPMKIVKVNESITIPEEFDMFKIVDSFKPLLINEVVTKNKAEKELLKNVLENVNADIPIVIENSDMALVSRLNTKWLLEDYTSLEDYADQKVTILCKVVGMLKQERVTIFNPLKDFIKLNRLMRRNSNKEVDAGLNPIVIDGPVVKVEVIALYK